MTPVTGVLLAAGAGRRFGGDKLAATLADGDMLALRSAAHLAAAVDTLVVVVRDPAQAAATALAAAGYRVVPCPDAALGMAHSLACGVRASADSAGWVIGLADMPALAPATLRELVRQFRRHDRIIVPVHAGRDGHPVIFPARYREALLSLSGDRGARSLLDTAAADVLRVAVEDAGVLLDVDTPADLAALGAPITPD